MYSDDVLQSAWAIAARHLAKGQKDPILMVAEGIMQERQKWQGEVHREGGGQLAGQAMEPR